MERKLLTERGRALYGLRKVVGQAKALAVGKEGGQERAPQSHRDSRSRAGGLHSHSMVAGGLLVTS